MNRCNCLAAWMMLGWLTLAGCDSVTDNVAEETPEQVAAVAISPADGTTFSDHLTVTLSTPTEGATIYYTLDGNNPVEATGIEYDGPFEIASSDLDSPWVTVQARAVKDEMLPSSMVSIELTAMDVPLTMPSVTPASREFSSSLTVTMTTTVTDGEIRYTTDGSDPTASSKKYTGSFSVTATTTVKARVYQGSLMPSAIVTRTYTLVAE